MLFRSGDLAGEVVRGRLGEASDDPQAAGVGHRRGQFGIADEVHAALDDRMLDAEEFCDPGLHGAWASCIGCVAKGDGSDRAGGLEFGDLGVGIAKVRSEEHTSELQSLMRISYAVFCLKKKIIIEP